MLQPCLPAAWNRVVCRRKYKNAIYHIAILRGRESEVYVDGVRYDGKILPYEEGKEYEVRMSCC